MSLIIDISINRRIFTGTLTAQRIEGSPGRMCKYKVSILDEGTQELDELGEIEHHYDDGATMLAWRVLDLWKQENS